MNQQQIDPGFHPVRRDQLREAYEHDSYKQQKKPPEPAICQDCGTCFHAGRWQWGARIKDAANVICPACQRVRDDLPAGYVYVGGDFFMAHREEILSLINHHALKEKLEHPLARIMAINDDGSGRRGIVITTTEIHLARDIGDALHNAYHGKLDFHYNAGENLLRVHWRR